MPTVFSASVEVLGALCYAQALTNVTLSAKKREFAAHKLVLSVWYGFFTGLFAKACRYDSQHAIFHPKNFDPNGLRYATNGRSTN